MAMTPGELLAIAPVIPVVVLPDAGAAIPLADALQRGGIRIVEVTLRTSAGLEAIRRIAAEVPDIVVGAGTVTTPSAAEDAHAAGAQFLVTPGATPALLDAAQATGLPLLPGAATVSEVLALVERDVTALKFFPAEASGGLGYLASVASVLPDVVFCPTGGITTATAAEYLALPNVACVGGSWLTPSDAVAAGDWERVTTLAREASGLRR
jgi:2-dehydro-3-deoxyphosphogluconate aldolase / (4S)-4-hydroxy-2-oxoglutarate aldolase